MRKILWRDGGLPVVPSQRWHPGLGLVHAISDVPSAGAIPSLWEQPLLRRWLLQREFLWCWPPPHGPPHNCVEAAFATLCFTSFGRIESCFALPVVKTTLSNSAAAADESCQESEKAR